MIARGTTPTIEYTFSEIEPSDIAVCYLTIALKSTEEVLIEKDLTDATVGESSISWTLTQEESMELPNDATTIIALQIRYRLTNGTAGHSPIAYVTGAKILKDGVI